MQQPRCLAKGKQKGKRVEGERLERGKRQEIGQKGRAVCAVVIVVDAVLREWNGGGCSGQRAWRQQ